MVQAGAKRVTVKNPVAPQAHRRITVLELAEQLGDAREANYQAAIAPPGLAARREMASR